MSETFKKDLDWGKWGSILITLLRPVVFFSHCLITSSSAIKVRELVDIDTSSYVLWTNSTLSLEWVSTKLLV